MANSISKYNTRFSLRLYINLLCMDVLRIITLVANIVHLFDVSHRIKKEEPVTDYQQESQANSEIWRWRIPIQN